MQMCVHELIGPPKRATCVKIKQEVGNVDQRGNRKIFCIHDVCRLNHVVPKDGKVDDEGA